MLLTLWWLWTRLRWALWPKPRTLDNRDRVIADRAALVLDKHLAGIPAPATGFAFYLDPYRASGKKFVGATDAIEAKLLTAIDRTKWVLTKHSMPAHLIAALLRDRDPERVAASKKVFEQVQAEAAADKAERSKRPPMLPPELPSTPPPPIYLEKPWKPGERPVESAPPATPKTSGVGGSKGTP